MSQRHFTKDLDLTATEQAEVLASAARMKKKPDDYRKSLEGKTLGMIFTKSSTRTRVSFEAGIGQLGGQAVFLTPAASQLGRGEPISDTAKVMSRYVDLLVIRTFDHSDVRELADSSTIPVINGLDDVYHPCQALADLLTIQENFGELKGRQHVYVGDCNNVAHSLILAGALAGVHTRLVRPDGWGPDDALLSQAQQIASKTSTRIEVVNDLAGVEGADAVYTDVWTSMGQEKEADKRRKAFADYQVNAKLMKRAGKDAIFLHCLPAHRGEEVTADVIDGDQSRVWDQAENRLHVQKALMEFLVKG